MPLVGSFNKRTPRRKEFGKNEGGTKIPMQQMKQKSKFVGPSYEGSNEGWLRKRVIFFVLFFIFTINSLFCYLFKLFILNF